MIDAREVFGGDTDVKPDTPLREELDSIVRQRALAGDPEAQAELVRRARA